MPNGRRNDISVLAQFESLLGDAVFSNDLYDDRIAGVNITFSCRNECILGECNGPLLRQFRLRHGRLVFQSDLIVQQRLQQGARRAAGPVSGRLVVANRIVRVDNAAALLVQAGQNVGHIVREESAVVHQNGQHLGDGVRCHGLVVRVLVALHLRLDQGRHRQCVAPATGRAEHRRAGQIEQFALITCVDGIAGAQARIAGDNNERVAGNGNDRSAFADGRMSWGANEASKSIRKCYSLARVLLVKMAHWPIGHDRLPAVRLVRIEIDLFDAGHFVFGEILEFGAQLVRHHLDLLVCCVV